MSPLTWKSDPKPYTLHDGRKWWVKPKDATKLQAAAHARRSDGSNAFYVVEVPLDADQLVKDAALSVAITYLEKMGPNCGCHLEERRVNPRTNADTKQSHNVVTVKSLEARKMIFCADHQWPATKQPPSQQVSEPDGASN